MNAEQIVNDIRNDIVPSPEQCVELNRLSLIDEIRQFIIPQDWVHIRKICDSDNKDQRELGFGLLKTILHEHGIKEYLTAYYSRLDLTFREYVALQFTLLNYNDLDLSTHKALLNLILENRVKWYQHALEWTGGETKVLEYCDQRLKGSPKTKHWIYIALLALAGHKDEAKKRINSDYIRDNDPVVKAMAEELTAKLIS